jgi:outer membrane immunogenic protein
MLLASAAITALSLSAANAADMPVKYHAAPPPVWSWTGFYIGAHVGSGWGTVEAEIPGGGFALASGTANGFLGGGQIGYNWQTGPVVVGVEFDASATNVKGTAPCVVGILVCKSEMNWMSTITGRVGFTADKALVYVKAGGAWANFKSSASILGIELASNEDKGRWGTTIGTGVEYAFTSNWSAKVEYNYLNFSKHTETFNTVVAVPINIDMTENVHAIKFGINYRFGGVAANY